jgi:hypothetical protein
MRWLLVLPETIDLPAMRSSLTELDGDFEIVGNPVPLGGGEISLEVVGKDDADFEAQIKSNSDVLGVFPSSDMTLY